jgi:hypothetical protein
MTTFRKAERKKARLRLGICGPSGAGKTKSALLIADGLGGKVALIDTENGSGDLYADEHQYDVAPLAPPYTPERYVALLHTAEKAGYDVVVLDSITHAWAGQGGLLDEHDKVAKASRSGNSYMAWREITPKHNAFIEAMLSSPCHVIATMRSKVDYILEDSGNGKQRPRKVGMAPIQREGMDYEFTTVFDLSVPDHLATVSKDRTSLFDGKPPFKPDAGTGQQLVDWLEKGVDPAVMLRGECDAAIGQAQESKDRPQLEAHWRAHHETAKSWGEPYYTEWTQACAEHGKTFKEDKEAT